MRRLLLVALTVSLIGLSASPAAAYAPGNCPICTRTVSDDHFTKVGATFARGVGNLGLGWMDLIRQPSRERKEGRMGWALGMGKGVGHTAMRMFRGVGDIVMCPLPKAKDGSQLAKSCPLCMMESEEEKRCKEEFLPPATSIPPTRSKLRVWTGRCLKMARKDPVQADAPIALTRTVKQPIERVFHFWSDVEALKKWWRPQGFKMVNAYVESRIGGEYTFELLTPDGDLVMQYGQFQEIVPPTKLVFTNKCEARDGCEQETLVRVALAPKGNSTEISVKHTLMPDPKCRAQAEQVWKEVLDLLEQELARQV
jgi:uncharacterized protein YndB with AHSA1/START domain